MYMHHYRARTFTTPTSTYLGNYYTIRVCLRFWAYLMLMYSM
jgi:hypothetical protein